MVVFPASIFHKLEEVFDISDRVVVDEERMWCRSIEKTEIVPNQIIADMIGREMDSFYPESHKTFGDEVFRVTDMVVPHPFAPNKNMIDGVSFGVKRGEILGLAGLVGSAEVNCSGQCTVRCRGPGAYLR